MAFSLSLMGHFTGEYFDEYDSKNIKQTAMGWITREQITDCYKGKEFYYSDFSGDVVYCNSIDSHIFNYYYEIWNNTKEFGLPHGQGWIAERQSILNVIKEMNNIYNKTVDLKRPKK